MVWFYVFISVVAVAILGIHIYWLVVLQKAQKLYFKEAQANAPTMFDVRELLLVGDKDMAVRLYAEIFNIEDIDRARKEVEDLDKNLKA